MRNGARFLEISQATNPNGRRKVKLVLHEIYPNREMYNKNGITYLEKYTRDNADSVKGMPLCAEFLDEYKDVPYGHGLTGNIKNMPVFENSVQVGVCDDWSIEDIEIDGEFHRCLCATGYVNECRYPNFVKWLEDKIDNKEPINGSVEFLGTKENEGEVIWEDGYKEKGRVPVIYDYIGYCILSVEPADPSAILIELNQLNNNNLEVTEMDETMKVALSEIVKAEISSAFANEKNAVVDERVASLEATNAELNAKVEELEKEIIAKDGEIASLNEKCASAEENARKSIEDCEAKVRDAEENACKKEAELNELKKENKITELNNALSCYSDEEKAFAKDEIEAFNADPFSVEINSITEKIEAASYRKMKEENGKIQVNSLNSFDGIISIVDPVTNDKDEVIEDFNCFG